MLKKYLAVRMYKVSDILVTFYYKFTRAAWWLVYKNAAVLFRTGMNLFFLVLIGKNCSRFLNQIKSGDTGQ